MSTPDTKYVAITFAHFFPSSTYCIGFNGCVHSFAQISSKIMFKVSVVARGCLPSGTAFLSGKHWHIQHDGQN